MVRRRTFRAPAGSRARAEKLRAARRARAAEQDVSQDEQNGAQESIEQDTPVHGSLFPENVLEDGTVDQDDAATDDEHDAEEYPSEGVNETDG